MKTIVLGGGCFWCLESIFQRIKGVSGVTSGYAGGNLMNPTYENLGTHAEAVEVEYDENIISLEKILEIFLNIHDPTTVNRQGNDVGEQYRSIILCSNHIETEMAHKIIKGNKDQWVNPIVTEVNLLDKFYPAENYHQNYYNNNHSAGYCQVVINPKIAKFKEKFAEYLQ